MKKTSYLILIGLLVIGGFLRLFRLNQTLQFLGDQGRDALIVRRLLVEHDPVFIGPVTSVGNMYLGPAYYYFMLPFFALTYPSPMGPVYAVAILGTLTIYVIYRLGKEMVGEQAALLAAFFYTFGWIFIIYSRFSWNPNPAPIVSMFMVYFTYKAWTKDSKYWIWVSVFFSVLMQLHYLTLLALPAAGIFWLLDARKKFSKKQNKLKPFVIQTITSIGIFITSLTPLILFDLKHQFLNAKAFYNILFGKEEQVRNQSQLIYTLIESLGRSQHILFEITTNHERWLNILMVTVFMGLLFLVLKKKSQFFSGERVLSVWLLVGIIGTSFYKSSVFDHYIAYLFPVTCLLLGVLLTYCWQHKLLKAVPVLFITWFAISNITQYDYSRVSWTVQDIENYSMNILKQVDKSEPYSLVGINSYNDIYAMNYRYYLTAWGKPPLETEAANEAKKIVIVNENYHPIKQVLDLPIYEIVIFPDKQNREVLSYPHAPDLIILRR